MMLNKNSESGLTATAGEKDYNALSYKEKTALLNEFIKLDTAEAKVVKKSIDQAKRKQRIANMFIGLAVVFGGMGVIQCISSEILTGAILIALGILAICVSIALSNIMEKQMRGEKEEVIQALKAFENFVHEKGYTNYELNLKDIDINK